MSISSSGARKSGPYSGNGSTAAFPFAFKVFQASDVLVVQTDTTPADHTLVLNTDYTVILNPNQDANPGGTVNMAVAPPTGYLLTIGSNVPELQSVTLTNNGGFYPAVINSALDYVTILIQQISEKVNRALVMPFSTNTSGQLPPVAPGQLLGWKADGSGIDNVGATGVGAGGIVASNMASGATGTALSADAQAASIKATPSDADELPLFDSAVAFSLKSLSWVNLKAALVLYLSGLTSTWAISITGNASTATTANDVVNITSGPIKGAVSNYMANVIGVNNYSVIVTADEAVLEDGAGKYRTMRSVNLTINAAGVVGDPLSIMSVRVASTWYYIWLWYNGTVGLAATLDASATAPTAPANYVSTDYNARMPGAVRTDGSGATYLLQTKTVGKVTQYVALAGSNTLGAQIMSQGVQGSPSTPTWVAVPVSAFVPVAIAAKIRVCISTLGAASTIVIAAPSAQYGGYTSSVNAPPMQQSSAGTTGVASSSVSEMVLESQSIYFASSSSSGQISCVGWEEN